MNKVEGKLEERRETRIDRTKKGVKEGRRKRQTYE